MSKIEKLKRERIKELIVEALRSLGGLGPKAKVTFPFIHATSQLRIALELLGKKGGEL